MECRVFKLLYLTEYSVLKLLYLTEYRVFKFLYLTEYRLLKRLYLTEYSVLKFLYLTEYRVLNLFSYQIKDVQTSVAHTFQMKGILKTCSAFRNRVLNAFITYI